MQKKKMSKETANKIDDYINTITKDGAGWASDNYIMTFTLGFSSAEKYEILYKLAQQGKLYNEDEIGIDEIGNDHAPTKGKMTTQDVDFIYGKLRK